MPAISHGWNGLTHGASSLVLAYLIVLLSTIAALIRSHAPAVRFLQSPLVAAALLLAAALIGVLVGALLHPLGMSADGVSSVLFDMALYALIGYSGGRVLASTPVRAGPHHRGAVVSPRSTAELPASAAGPTPADESSVLTLAGVPVAPEDETKHFKLIGTTGTGKSTAIRELLNAALARGDRAIIADPDGGYLRNFFDAERGDVILNPFEPDSVKWNLLAEIRNEYDVDQLARSLIPDGGSDGLWTGYARTFFSVVTQQAVKGGIRDDATVHGLLTTAPMKELRVLLAGTAAAPFLEEGNEKMFGSVRSIAGSAVYPLKYTMQQPGVPFSVRQWVGQGAARRNGGRGGVLFLPYKAGEIAALRSVISAWMRIAIFEAMNREEGDQRLWFVVDELDALGEIDGLKDALARLRKFGGRCILGFQSISQVSATYGKGVADTIVENCGNTLILRCSASEHGGTSQFASRLIGQREVVHTSRSRTRQPAQWLATTSTTEHLTIEPAVMASEIERLADLEGLLKLTSIPDWKRVGLSYVSYPTKVRLRPASPAASPLPSGATSSSVGVAAASAPHPPAA